jgi:hypothetical protein
MAYVTHLRTLWVRCWLYQPANDPGYLPQHPGAA